VILTDTLGSPLPRMNSMRSSRDIWFNDFCTALTSTTPSVVTYMRPSLPDCGSLSLTTAVTKLPLFDNSLSFRTS
jgi:hypothetical protein